MERKKPDAGDGLFNASELKYILDVNQKSIEIYVEVEKQNEQILHTLEYFKEVATKVEDKLATIKTSEATIEELLRDDNEREHSAIIAMLHKITDNIKTLNDEIKELKSSTNNHSNNIDDLAKLIETEVKPKISDIDKNIFRLVIILGSAGIGTIFTIIQTFLHK